MAKFSGVFIHLKGFNQSVDIMAAVCFHFFTLGKGQTFLSQTHVLQDLCIIDNLFVS